VCSFRSALKSSPVDTTAESQVPPAALHQPLTINHPPSAREFGDYELLEEIARGGMGIVYKARQRSLDRVVALKMLLFGPQASPEFAKRFRAEAVLAASLQHPHIVAIHEVSVHEGQQFFVMDYVEGPTLARLVGHQPLPARRAAGYLKTVAEAVHFAHERGILHRDLKPSNVLVDAQDQPRVTDFGLARRFEGDSQVTLTGQVLGSPNYIPPEQALGKRGKVSRQSDVYALGAMLYHLLTGRPPFQGETLTDTLQQVLNTEPLAPRLLNPSAPRDLETICLKCLEKEPARRYATAQALADELDRFLHGQPVLARSPGPTGKIARWCRRQPVRAGLSAALVLTFLLGLLGILWQLNRARAGELLALRHAYAGDIKEAQRALEEGDLGGARRTLDKYRPGKRASGVRQPTLGVDLRGWEWRYLWGQCRSDEQFTLTHQPNGFESLALSPDGSLLAVRQPGGNIDLWDWARRRQTGTLTNQSLPRAMAFVPGGNLLASASQDAKGFMICYWDLTTRQVVRTMPQPSRVVSLAFSPDGEWLATFDVDPRLRLWRVSTGELMNDIPGLGAMNDLGRVPLFSPDGATFALGEMNGSIRLVSLRTGLINTTIPGPTEGNGVMALAYSPDGRLLASGYGQSDSTIRLWDAVTGAPAGSLEGHRGWVSRLVFAPDGQTLYSGSSDQTIRVWDVAQKKELDRLRGRTGGLAGLALSRDGNTLVSCASDGSIRVWDLKSKRQRASHAVLPVRVGPFGAPFSRDGRHLITASPNDPVITWEVATAKEIQRLPA
jgi:WD40 repeat protein/predicted Ser/Thr protein kinase